MEHKVLWKVVGKSDGLEMVFYRKEDQIELVNIPIEGDVVELENGECAIVYYRDDECRLLTESDIERMDLDDNSYRSQ